MARQSEKTKAKAAAAKTVAKAVVYMGPNTGDGLTHGQIFRGGLPPAAKDKNPVLFAALAEFPEAKIKLADPTSALAKAYGAAKGGNK